VAKVIENGP